jgi:hypothetical protein
MEKPRVKMENSSKWKEHQRKNTFLGGISGNSILGKDNQWKIPVCVRILQCNFPLWLEESILEHVLTLPRSKKHFPCQEDFSPDTSLLWSEIQHSVL